MEGVEPAAGLIDRLGDKGRRKLLLQEFLVLKGIVELRVGAGARVKPDIDHLGNALHLAAALRAGNRKAIHIGAVQLDSLCALVAGERCQLFAGADRKLLAAVRALPDIERRAPVAVSRDRPVLNVLNPVAEAPLADGLRHPVDFLIVPHEVVAHRGHPDEPGLARIVDERCAAAPAVRIVVLDLRGCKEQSSLLEILQHFRICRDSAFFDFLLGRLAAHARKFTGLGLHLSLIIDHLNEGRVISATHARIVLTEGRGNVDNAGTVGHRDILIRVDKERLFMLARYRFRRTAVERLIGLMLELLAGIARKDFIALAEHLLKQCLREIVGVAVRCLDLHIALVRIDAERDVRGQGPGRRGPGEEVRVFAFHPEADNRGSVLDCLIALCDLVRGERGAAVRAVGNHLKALVEQVFVPDFL